MYFGQLAFLVVHKVVHLVSMILVVSWYS